jgi:cytoskeletal protein CcmA (bactofilin family)
MRCANFFSLQAAHHVLYSIPQFHGRAPLGARLPTVEVSMWRRQEQPKSSSPAAEATVSSAVETSLPPSPAPSKPTQDAVALGSRLTSALTIKGEITGSEDLFIDARLEGLVKLSGATAVVGPSGRVAANITATHIVIQGDLHGSLRAAERVRISSTGKVRGNINCRRISVEDGAEIHGSVEVTRDVAAPVLIPTSADVAVPRAAQAVASMTKESSAA